MSLITKNQKIIECEDFSFQRGLHYLSLQQIDIFLALSFSCLAFKNGELDIDDAHIFLPRFANGHVEKINIHLKHTGRFSLLYFVPNEDTKLTTYKYLISELQHLSFRGKSEESKVIKLAYLETILDHIPTIVLLLNMNDQLNFLNKKAWENAFEKTRTYCFFLANNFTNSVYPYQNEIKNYKLVKELTLNFILFLANFLSELSLAFSIFLLQEKNYFWICLSASALLFPIIGTAIIPPAFMNKARNCFTTNSNFRSYQNLIQCMIGICFSFLLIWMLAKKQIFFSSTAITGMSLASLTLWSFVLLFGNLLISRKNAKKRY